MLDDLGEVGHFEDVLFGGNGVGGVVGREGRGELGDDFAAVADVGDVVDGHACLCVACCLDGFVHVMAPHAASAMTGQEGWMEVDDATWEGVDEIVGNHQQEACEDDEVDVVLAEEGQEDVGIVEVGLGYDDTRHAQSLGSDEGVGIGAVADDEDGTDVVAAFKITDEVLAVGTASAHEDGYVIIHNA